MLALLLLCSLCLCQKKSLFDEGSPKPSRSPVTQKPISNTGLLGGPKASQSMEKKSILPKRPLPRIQKTKKLNYKSNSVQNGGKSSLFDGYVSGRSQSYSKIPRGVSPVSLLSQKSRKLLQRERSTVRNLPNIIIGEVTKVNNLCKRYEAII